LAAPTGSRWRNSGAKSVSHIRRNFKPHFRSCNFNLSNASNKNVEDAKINWKILQSWRGESSRVKDYSRSSRSQSAAEMRMPTSHSNWTISFDGISLALSWPRRCRRINKRRAVELGIDVDYMEGGASGPRRTSEDPLAELCM